MDKKEFEKAKNFEDFLRETAKIVDPKVKEVLGIYVDKKTQKLLNYQIEIGGKRLRPGLAIASCLVCNGKIEDVLYPAAGLEILHNCTLIIDDIIDNSKLRRGKPTIWFKFGKSIAECIGIDYMAAIFQAANRSKNPVEASELFAKTLKILVKGEILDLLFEQQGRIDEPYIVKNRYQNITEKDYFEMVSKKTAILFQVCCETGAICAKAKKEEIDALKNYGLNLGIAFQIQDDILDVFGDKKKTGKERIGHDIKGKKLSNIVILSTLKELPLSEKKKILTIFKKREIEDKDVKEVIGIINETNAEEKSNLLREKYIQKTKKSLKILPKNKWNEVLNKIADFVVERNK